MGWNRRWQGRNYDWWGRCPTNCTWNPITAIIVFFTPFACNLLSRKKSISPATDICELEKYWGCNLWIVVATFEIGGATATSKQYKALHLPSIAIHGALRHRSRIEFYQLWCAFIIIGALSHVTRRCIRLQEERIQPNSSTGTCNSNKRRRLESMEGWRRQNTRIWSWS